MSVDRSTAAVLIALTIGVSACSGDGGSSTPTGSADTTDSTTISRGGPNASGDVVGPSTLPSVPQRPSDDPERPWTLGYEVAAPDGTIVVIDAALQLLRPEDGPQQVSATWSITDRTRGHVFGIGVLSADLTVTVTEGGPATVTAVWARRSAPGESTGEDLDVDERLGSVEVNRGKSAELSLP